MIGDFPDEGQSPGASLLVFSPISRELGENTSREAESFAI